MASSCRFAAFTASTLTRLAVCTISRTRYGIGGYGSRGLLCLFRATQWGYGISVVTGYCRSIDYYRTLLSGSPWSDRVRGCQADVRWHQEADRAGEGCRLRSARASAEAPPPLPQRDSAPFTRHHSSTLRHAHHHHPLPSYCNTPSIHPSIHPPMPFNCLYAIAPPLLSQLRSFSKLRPLLHCQRWRPLASLE